MAKLGEILISRGQLDPDQLNAALAQQRQWAGLLGQILIEMELCDEMAVYEALASQFGIKLASIASINIHPDIVRTIPAALCKEKRVFPVHFANKQLMVATAFPQDVQTPDQVAFQTGLRVQLVLVAEREIEWAIRRYHQNDPSPCPPPKTKKALPKEEEMKLLDAAGKTMVGKTLEDLKREHEAAQGHAAAPPAPPHAPF